MKKWRMLLLALLLALLCGCAASEPLPDYAPEESQRLILYTSHKKEVWQPIVKEFEAPMSCSSSLRQRPTRRRRT